MQPRLKFAVFTALALSTIAARAQENVLGAPPALEFPFEAKPEAPNNLPMSFFRFGVEKAADFALCKILMKQDKKAGLLDTEGNETCLPAYAEKVAKNEGFIRWAPNARPVNCSSCFSRLFNDPELNTLRPNLRRFTASGRLTFVSVTGPNRTIAFPYQVRFTCDAANGARRGNLAVGVSFDSPFIGEPGFWESVASFFTAGELSRWIDGRIKRELSPLGSLRTFQGPCQSVGVDHAENPKYDALRFDPAVVPRPSIGVTGVDTATIQLLRIKRNPLPPGVAIAHAKPGAVEARQFTLFTNGVVRQLPPAALTIPAEGGSVPLNFSESVSLGGANRLQLLFVNNLGGAVWSEFVRPAKFGDGPTRTMTTGRTILVPSRSGRPGARPVPVLLREFELTYRITFTPRPRVLSDAADTKPKQPSIGPTKG